MAGDVNSNIGSALPPSGGASLLDPLLNLISNIPILINLTNEGENQIDANNWYNQGANFYNKGYYVLALSCANTSISSYANAAIEQHGLISNCWTLKGASLYMLGRYSEAIDSCDKAINIEPTNARAWHTKGIALYRLGKYKEAVLSCNRALEVDPSDTKAWDYRKMACNALGCTD
ncbi:MAG: tetratricopeptide repeat protein [Methanotrichaceae archaeon]